MSAFKRTAVMIVVALVGALLISLNSNNKLTYEDRLIRAGLNEVLGPEARSLLHESPELQALFLDYSEKTELVLNARIAIYKYGDGARDILQKYGTESEFKDVLVKYGASAIPVIQYFVENNSFSLNMIQAAKQKFIGAANNIGSKLHPANIVPAQPAVASASFEPTDRGWYAIQTIHSGGHNFLGQFEITKDGKVVRIQINRLIQIIGNFFVGGLRELEIKNTLDQEIKAVDLFWAGVDAAFVISSVKVLRVLKLARIGKPAQELSFLNRTKLLTNRLIPKNALGRSIMKGGAVVGTIFVTVKHPGVLNGIFANLAQLFGLNPQLVQVTCWAILIYAICLPLSPILRILLPVLIQALSLLSASISQLNRLFALNKPAGEIHE